MSDHAPWYVVVGFGAVRGTPKKTPEDAWESYYYVNRQRYAPGRAQFRAATRATLYAASTKPAAAAADISQVGGRHNRMGEWWRA